MLSPVGGNALRSEWPFVVIVIEDAESRLSDTSCREAGLTAILFIYYLFCW